jgi:hypothetical protein
MLEALQFEEMAKVLRMRNCHLKCFFFIKMLEGKKGNMNSKNLMGSLCR